MLSINLSLNENLLGRYLFVLNWYRIRTRFIVTSDPLLTVARVSENLTVLFLFLRIQISSNASSFLFIFPFDTFNSIVGGSFYYYYFFLYVSVFHFQTAIKWQMGIHLSRYDIVHNFRPNQSATSLRPFINYTEFRSNDTRSSGS